MDGVSVMDNAFVDSLFFVFIAVFVLLIVLIAVFLVLLSRQGDERYQYIKTKAMANAFIATVGAVVFKLCYGIYNTNRQITDENIANISLLVAIAVIFLVSLIWQKRKHGG